MTVSSPQPTVLHLVTLFRQISSGDVRIPAFQREFVWRESQIIELLDSVLSGYPIGSLLLWYVDKRLLKIADHAITTFPEVAERYPTSYVLDGMQRLSSLYGVFNFGTSTSDDKFNVLYNLREGEFVHRRDIDHFSMDYSVPLSALFVPRKLLEIQSILTDLEDGETLIERLLGLQAAFQDYMIPVVTIRDDDINRIVGMFEKINSTGTPLDTVDFMRAITWAEDFDLNEHLSKAGEILEARQFKIYEETIIKCVGLLLGVTPTSEGLLALRRYPPKDLERAFSSFLEAFDRVIDFLSAQFEIRSSDFVPYEGQYLVLFKAIGMQEARGDDEIRLLVRWFWAIGFNEGLRGKPDHYVVRAVQDWRSLIMGTIRGLEPRLKISPTDFMERRVIKGKALSAAFSAMMAVQKAQSVVTGDLIMPEFYVGIGSSKSFAPVYSPEDLSRAGITGLNSAKIFANVMVEDVFDTLFEKRDMRVSILQAIQAGNLDRLASQFITQKAVDCLFANDIRGFLAARAEAMHDRARDLVENA